MKHYRAKPFNWHPAPAPNARAALLYYDSMQYTIIVTMDNFARVLESHWSDQTGMNLRWLISIRSKR